MNLCAKIAPVSMKIQISKGTGDGPTELAAFDHALIRAGTANYNLIYLSSVLPIGSNIEVCEGPASVQGAWGDRLYIVIAQNRTSLRNKEAWAGIGWVQNPKTKEGLLVEHIGYSEAEVRADIENSLQGLAKNRRQKFGPVSMVVTGIRCQNRPVCALVVASFRTEGWEQNPSELSRLQRIASKINKSR